MMRQIPSVGAAAKAEFSVHLAPPATTAPPPSPQCDGHRCPWRPYSGSKDFKVNTALVLVFLFCTLICAAAFNVAVRYIIRMHCARRRQRREPPNPKAELGCAAAEKEADVPAVIYSEGVKLVGAAAECAICLSEFAAGERIRVLEECGHGFHVQCIERWLVSCSSCPTCRANCSVKSNPSPP
ncbi:RING-H2 finger protein ATL78 [Sesamum angolense]|uniref:RING-type E3 ubiquitin transferase n=1 Tax=Sesamum angolense TaxID=2727404 RepID=A0AAE2BP25_9LAMI|nr:RING-H2 finger protein ATL78 [Sesamum angolense]